MLNERSQSFISAIILALFIAGGLLVFPTQTVKIANEATLASVVETTPVQKLNPFEEQPLIARSAYVYDVTSRTELYSKNGSEALPLASLTKVMTTMVAAEAASSSAMVVIHHEDLAQDGDSGLYGEEKWQLSDLLKYTLIVSSNDGASAVAASVGALNQGENSTETSKQYFVRLMNQKAQDFSLTSMRFYNESGLDVSENQAGAYGSAKDVAKLLAHAVIAHPDIFSVTRFPELTLTSESHITHKAINTDILTSTVDNLVAGKTGYTVLAGGNLAVAFTASNGHIIIASVLGSTYDGRFSDVHSLIEAANKTLAEL